VFDGKTATGNAGPAPAIVAATRRQSPVFDTGGEYSHQNDPALKTA
jgi:hypothetical protein